MQYDVMMCRTCNFMPSWTWISVSAILIFYSFRPLFSMWTIFFYFSVQINIIFWFFIFSLTNFFHHDIWTKDTQFNKCFEWLLQNNTQTQIWWISLRSNDSLERHKTHFKNYRSNNDNANRLKQIFSFFLVLIKQ